MVEEPVGAPIRFGKLEIEVRFRCCGQTKCEESTDKVKSVLVTQEAVFPEIV